MAKTESKGCLRQSIEGFHDVPSVTLSPDGLPPKVYCNVLKKTTTSEIGLIVLLVVVVAVVVVAAAVVVVTVVVATVVVVAVAVDEYEID